MKSAISVLNKDQNGTRIKLLIKKILVSNLKSTC